MFMVRFGLRGEVYALKLGRSVCSETVPKTRSMTELIHDGIDSWRN